MSSQWHFENIMICAETRVIALCFTHAGNGSAVVCGFALLTRPSQFKSHCENQFLCGSFSGKLVLACLAC